MSIWFYLFLVVLLLLVILLIKHILMKNEINNILESLVYILKSDTNNLITVSSNDKDLKNLANALNKSLKSLRKKELEYRNGNQGLKSSITNMSHDLRTPLTAIRGYLDLMESENLNKRQRKYLKIIDVKVNDLISLTEELFYFSKAKDEEEKIKCEPVLINDVLEEVIVSFYALFKESKITPTISISDEKITRLVNKDILKRIFENIISNAIKYGEKEVLITLDSDGVIVFSNKTYEIDATSLEKIFDRYYTVKNVKKSTGLGLSIAKQLVELMNGCIKAEYKSNYLQIKIWFK